ncbi:hypothetical protein [Salibacterium aidingense]|uniref:hypothetical protein n=1 Tax=Salibacterium aidingense TaxID=384933 RepID=UPI000402A713|nr:hypothetical protein [Salibacterium aidingense]
MNNESEYIQQQPYPGTLELQSFLNDLLRQLSTGKIDQGSVLLRTVKKKWKQINVHEFSSVYLYVSTMITIMDEALKLLPAFPLQGRIYTRYVENIFMAGTETNMGQTAQAWIFFSGSNERKQHIMFKAIEYLETIHPNNSWTLTAADITTGERFCRTKYE